MTSARRKVGRLVHVRFLGHFESDAEHVYAVCDTVPMVTHGAGQDEAMEAMGAALEVYLDTLRERGEFRAAVEHFGMDVIEADQKPIVLRSAAPITPKSTFQALMPIRELALA